MGLVEGMVATLTGGASGIGAACAMPLARAGAKFVITDLNDTGSQIVMAKTVVILRRGFSTKRN